jgi:hypothetical protein
LYLFSSAAYILKGKNCWDQNRKSQPIESKSLFLQDNPLNHDKSSLPFHPGLNKDDPIERDFTSRIRCLSARDLKRSLADKIRLLYEALAKRRSSKCAKNFEMPSPERKS